MHKQQLGHLFIANLIPLIVGMGLFPVLPLYATQLGATSTEVGFIYAITYAASVAGIALTGWLGHRVPRRALFVAGGAVGLPALVLLAYAAAIWQVALATALIWFAGAVTITLVNIFTGLIGGGRRQGALFGILVMAYPVGSVVGGAAVGRLVAWRGYHGMFLALALLWTLLPLIGLLGLRGIPGPTARHPPQHDTAAPPLDRSFRRLLIAALLSALAINASRLGTSLSMEALGFSADAVASTAVVSGIFAAPISLLTGLLADRLGHRRVLFGGYALAIAGTALLLGATELWHFWAAASLLFVAWCVNTAVTSALAASSLTPAALSRGIPRLNAMDSLASIVGFAGAGFVMDTLDPAGLYLIAAGLAAAAAPVLASLPRRSRPTDAPRYASPIGELP